MREPSPPYGHVSWRDAREGVEHDAAVDVTLLAETVMGREGALRSPESSSYLAKIARYPLWAICVRALIGAALLPVPVFLYAASRYHYLVNAGAEYHVDQNAVLNGLALALAGAFVGAMMGAFWGSLVVRHARRQMQSGGGDS